VTKRIELNDYKFNISYDDYQYLEKETDVIQQDKKVILFDDDQDGMIYKFMEKVMNEKDENEKNYIVDNIKFYNGRVQAFKHPFKNIIYESTPYFSERKNIIDGLIEKYGKTIVKFENQSYTTISQIIYNNEFGTTQLLESNLSETLYNIFINNDVRAFQGNVNTDLKQDLQSTGVDVIKSYSSVLINNDTEYSIFQPFD